MGFSSFLPIFFHDQYGVDMITAGTITACCGLAGSLARPVGGHMADRVGGRHLLRGGLLLAGGLCVFLAWLPPLFWAVPFMLATLLLLGFGNGVIFQMVSLSISGRDGHGVGIHRSQRQPGRIFSAVLVRSLQGCHRDVRKRISGVCSTRHLRGEPCAYPVCKDIATTIVTTRAGGAIMV